MHNSFTVQFSNRKYNLDGIKLYNILRESLLRFEYFIQLSAAHKRHYKVKSSFCLEQKLHANQERVIGCEQNLFLQLSALNLVVLD